jgi:hypothetical protein
MHTHLSLPGIPLKNSFIITRAEILAADADALKASIVVATGSESGADSILRSIERMGTDDSIEHFEMTEITGSRRYGGAAPAGWRVRADRGLPEVPTG